MKEKNMSPEEFAEKLIKENRYSLHHFIMYYTVSNDDKIIKPLEFIKGGVCNTNPKEEIRTLDENDRIELGLKEWSKYYYACDLLYTIRLGKKFMEYHPDYRFYIEDIKITYDNYKTLCEKKRKWLAEHKEDTNTPEWFSYDRNSVKIKGIIAIAKNGEWKIKEKYADILKKTSPIGKLDKNIIIVA